MASKEEEEKTYQPKDAVGEGIRATLILGAVGLTVSAVQNTLTRQNVGAWGVFTRTGGVITLFGAIYFIHSAHSGILIEKQPPLEGPMASPGLPPRTFEREMIAGTRQLQVFLLARLGVSEVSKLAGQYYRSY